MREVFHHARMLTGQLLDEQHERLRRWLDPPDPSTNYNKAIKERFPGTGTWFINSPAFIEWKTTSKAFPWLYGIPGCGKSILSSTIIKAVFEHCSPNPASSPLYYFFDFQDKDKQQTEKMLRSLIAQISSQCLTSPQPLEELYAACANGNRQPTYRSLLSTLRQMMESFRETFLVLDAPDECSDRDQLHSAIEELVSWEEAQLHILTTSRRVQDIENVMENIIDDQQKKVCIQSTLISDDIRAYVRGRLQTDQALQR